MNFSIVIPIFNEKKNIRNLVNEIKNYLSSSEFDFEIILVNDASTDDSLKEISLLSSENPNIVKVLNNNLNIGQSFSIIKGVKSSKYNTIVTLDGDGQNNPKDISLLVKKYFTDDELYLVGGVRLKRKDTLIKIISSKIANNIRNFFLKDDCVDTGCSLKVFDKKVFLMFPEFKGLHRFLPALFKGYQKKTFFIEVDHRKRIYGQSNYGTLKRLLSGIMDIIRVKIITNKIK